MVFDALGLRPRRAGAGGGAAGAARWPGHLRCPQSAHRGSEPPAGPPRPLPEGGGWRGAGAEPRSVGSGARGAGAGLLPAVPRCAHSAAGGAGGSRSPHVLLQRAHLHAAVRRPAADSGCRGAPRRVRHRSGGGDAGGTEALAGREGGAERALVGHEGADVQRGAPQRASRLFVPGDRSARRPPCGARPCALGRACAREASGCGCLGRPPGARTTGHPRREVVR